MSNPLLQAFDTPFETAPFDKIKLEDYMPAIKAGLEEGRKEIDEIRTNTEAPTFENTIEALEASGELLDRTCEIFFNLTSAETNDEMQALAQEISPLLTAYENDIMLDSKLFERVQAVYQQKDQLTLTAEQSMLLEKTYKAFARNGASLSDDNKEIVRDIDNRIAKLSLTFGENVLKETNNFELLLEDEKDLEGLPESVIEGAAHAAKEKDKKGYLFTLEIPSFLPFVTYSKKRALRKKMMQAFGSRAFKGNEYDNSAIVREIVELRDKRAKLLGYRSHADFTLEERMAESPSNVWSFLDDLLKHAKPAAKLELDKLRAYAKQLDGLDDLQRWDFAYYTEKLKKERFEIDDETLKPYFKLENVIDGVFKVAQRLYGLHFIERTDIPKYHKDVITYVVKDEQKRHVGVFYADFFPRAGKRDGAWMTSYRGQKKVNGNDQRPHISIVCNFTKPTPSRPSLLTFDEVTTLFHEFGHALHGLLADGTYESLTGPNVYWDFVELPSQITENWCYEKEALDLFARHYETGERIPADIIDKLKESASFMEGYATTRQVGLSRLDMAWHDSDPKDITSVEAFEREATASTSVLPPLENTLTSTAFSHIFQGGYAAGYYSYKWAEVLDADAFECFKENGIFDKITAEKFKKHILSAGGSEHPMTLYKRFRGKEPSPEALLRRAGLLSGKEPSPVK